MRTATFKIGGMHCASCAARNERALQKVQGVMHAAVNFATYSARVEFDEKLVSRSGWWGRTKEWWARRIEDYV